MDMDYNPQITEEVVAELERAAREVGLPLHRLELLGQDPAMAAAFVESVDDGYHEDFLDVMDWESLERAHFRRRRAVLDAVAEIAAEQEQRAARARQTGR